MGVAVVQVDRSICSIGEILEVARHSARQTPTNRRRPTSSSTQVPEVPVILNLMDLTGAISSGSFYAVSQPILELDQERVVGHELLSRGPVGSLEMPVTSFASHWKQTC